MKDVQEEECTKKVKVKVKVVPVLNYLSSTPRRRMWEWMYRSTFS
jgi:hypothetical protein